VPDAGPPSSGAVSTDSPMLEDPPGRPAPELADWPGVDDAVELAPGKAVAVGEGRLTVEVRPSKGEKEAPGGVTASVRLFSPKEAVAAGFERVAFNLERTDFGDVDATASVEIDLKGLDGAYGGDWLTRLRLVELIGCNIEKNPEGCRDKTGTEQYWVSVDFQTMKATVIVPLLSQRSQKLLDEKRAAEPKPNPILEGFEKPAGPPYVLPTDIPAPAGLGGRGRSVLPANHGGSHSSFGFSSGTSGSAGDWSATPLGKSSSWSVGTGTGEFSWSYPIPVPPAAAGPTPSLSVSYSSGAIDGMTAEANNQGSWVGAGWDLSTGFIERRFRTCPSIGDLCWFTNSNGQRDFLVISLNGRSSELIPIGTDEWRLKDDPGWSVIRRPGVSQNSPKVGTRENDSEYFEVRTGDGTVYLFGYGQEPNSLAWTNSVWTVPVYGDNVGEPCYQAFCQQGWRFNLDRVVTPMMTNSATQATGWTVETLSYDVETNFYGQQGTPGQTAEYARGGNVKTIAYTKIAGQEQNSPSMVVEFNTDQRCANPNADPAIGCSAAVLTDAAQFPDVPTDLVCGSVTCSKYSPSFFTGRRLKSIETKANWNTGTPTLVDRITFTHELPPTDVSAKLWLRSIQRTGFVGGTTTTPAVRFEGAVKPNRPFTSAGVLATNLYRVTEVKDEFGGRTVVTYGQPAKPGAASGCDIANQSSPEWDLNERNCYPAWFEPTGTGAPPAAFVAFNKWLLTKVEQFDGTTIGSPTVTTSYEYQGAPAWHHDDDPMSPVGSGWGIWRGYADTIVRVGPPGGPKVSTRTIQYRGMNGDKCGAPRGPCSAGTKTMTIPTLWDGGQPDEALFLGRVRDSATLGTYDYPVSFTSSSYSSLPGQGLYPRKAVVVWQSSSVSRTHTGGPINLADLNEGGWFSTLSTTPSIDQFGHPLQQITYGDTSDPTQSTCTTTDYATSMGPISAYLWISGIPRQVTTRTGSGCTTGTVISDVKYFYSGNVGLTSTPLAPVVTKTETSTGTGTVVDVAGYVDVFGRQTSQTDRNGNTSTASYSYLNNAAALQQPDKIVMTNPAGHTSTATIERSRGRITRVVDPNNRVTDVTYDPLGRVSKVWLPGNDSTDTNFPSLEHLYQLPTDWSVGTQQTPASTVTKSLLWKPNELGGGATAARPESGQIFDGFGRVYQQGAQSANGKTITVNSFDGRGLQTEASAPFGVTDANVTALAAPGIQPDLKTVTGYDSVGRPTLNQTFSRSGAVWNWQRESRTAYQGRWTSSYGPVASVGTASSRSDGLGRATDSIDGGQDCCYTDVAATRTPDGVQHQVVVGTDNVIYYRKQLANGSWTTVESLGGSFTDVAISALSGDRLAVAARGTNGVPYMRVQTTAGVFTFTVWQDLGGGVDDIAIATYGDKLHVWGPAGKTVYQNNQTVVGGAMSGFYPIGDPNGYCTCTYRISGAAYADGGGVTVAVTNVSTGAVYKWQYLTATGVIGWGYLTAAVYDIAVATTPIPAGSQITLYGTGGDGYVLLPMGDQSRRRLVWLASASFQSHRCSGCCGHDNRL
jgi:YD repeat-containing protein